MRTFVSVSQNHIHSKLRPSLFKRTSLKLCFQKITRNELKIFIDSIFLFILTFAF